MNGKPPNPLLHPTAKWNSCKSERLKALLVWKRRRSYVFPSIGKMRIAILVESVQSDLQWKKTYPQFS